jgi:protein-disulfide isomerase
MRRQEQAKAKQRQRLVVIGVIVGIVVIVLAILVPVLLSGGGGKNGPVALPAGVSGKAGPIVVGTGPARLDLYEDFQCPSCRELQQTAGPMLDGLEKTGKATASYYMMSFLGPESVRAANAGGCAQDQGKFKPFYDYLYAHQPPEKTGGFTSTDLINAGKAVGITSPVFSDCVNGMKYQDWVNNVNAAGLDRTNHTPTVFVNGREITNPTPENIQNAVSSAG